MADKSKGGAYGDNSNDYRRKWDKDEYAARAKAQDAASAEYAQSASAAALAGKKPPPRPRAGDNVGPKPTKALEAREEDLGIERNLGKSMLVAAGGKGPGAGFYCEMCRRTLKDSIAYLDHVNGRSHLARLGQTTQVRRSTVAQVRDRINLLRAQSLEKVTSKNFDFDARLKLVAQEEEARRKEKKEGKKRKRDEARLKSNYPKAGEDDKDENGVKRTKGAFGNAKKEQEEEERTKEEERAFEAMMGFSGGFGGGVKRR